ncbi:AIG2-like protein D isoform X2 [Cryptomeria japonica]|uniref:AIG2-like protein D isoform X2 n=1 Tax=Cryptomeria japonica TaxID=3369 RepID=UPI0027DA58C1|nr:AIG2-like protein D isoform X2 [Cryptomeria japonica]
MAAATSMQLHNVFVYGSLMADEVVKVLLNRIPSAAPALLPGQRHSIRERVYPAIIPAEKDKVNGKVLLSLADHELDILDKFEDVDYKRTLEEVIVLDNEKQQNSSSQLKAYTYVWADVNDKDLYGEWNFEAWKDSHMKDFVKMCENFMSDLKQPSTTRHVSI